MPQGVNASKYGAFGEKIKTNAYKSQSLMNYQGIVDQTATRLGIGAGICCHKQAIYINYKACKMADSGQDGKGG